VADNRLLSIIEHPLAFGSFRNWVRLLKESKGIDKQFIPRILAVSFLTAMTAPLRLYEELRYGKLVDQAEIHPSPIFIIGHWRSGTTHLHNLLSKDRNLGYISTYQAMAPGFFMAGCKIIKPLLGRIAHIVHPTRIIDNVPLKLDAPQEEDFAIANLSPHSFLHIFTFPRKADYYFKRYALFDGVTEETKEEWKLVYLNVLRQASLSSNSNRLVLKSPSSSGKIPAVLELFPDAKFIHVYRNPYRVFLSMLWVYQSVLPRAQVQWIDWYEIERKVLSFYSQLMNKFLKDRKLIPHGNLVEVKFEDLETAPIDQLRGIYERLSLPGYVQAEPAFKSYLASIASYRKNEYELTAEAITKVNHNWGFALDAWGYERK
jgi:hypothetical protein